MVWHGARAVVDEQALVALPVLEVVLHLLGRVADAHLDVGVAEEDDRPVTGSPCGLMCCVLV
jgi:hypothetical protein